MNHYFDIVCLRFIVAQILLYSYLVSVTLSKQITQNAVR